MPLFVFSPVCSLEKDTQRHTHAQCAQMSTLGHLNVPEAYLFHGSELKSEITGSHVLLKVIV